jgi:hypothetical protein
MDYTLSIVTYSDHSLPEHWLFLIQTTTWTLLHPTQGSPGDYFYPGKEQQMLGNLAGFKARVDIGRVGSDRLGDFEDIVKSTRILIDLSSTWSCHDWCIEALKALRDAGFVDEHVTEEGIRNALT